MRSSTLPTLTSLVCALAGCTGSLAVDDAGEAPGVITAELTRVPVGVACVSLEIGGSLAREVRASVTPGVRTTLDTGLLPAIPIVLQARAYPVACPETGDDIATDPTWISDAVEMTPSAGRETPVALVLRPFTPGTVEIDFQPVLVDVAIARDATYWVTAEGRILAAGVPARVGGLRDVHEIDAAGDHACAIHGSDARVSCWGPNESGQLGNGTLTASDVPVAVGLSDVREISVSGSHACAVEGSGRVLCWGANVRNQVSPSTSPRVIFPTPVSLPGGARAEHVAVGSVVSCASSTSGGIYCWGQFPRSSGGLLTTPTHVGGTAGREGAIVELSMFGLEPVFVTELGTVHRWRYPTDELVPVEGADAVLIAASGVVPTTSMCVVDWRGALRCAGGAAGAPSSHVDELVQPRRVDGAVLVEIGETAGRARTCVVDSAGDPWCWGEGGRGELGDGGTSDRPVPVRVRHLDPAPSPPPQRVGTVGGGVGTIGVAR